MLDLFNIAKPQGCDIQKFIGLGGDANNGNNFAWNKPRGVSHVYMMLIGGGGNGDGATGGGSGAVTVWYGAAQHVPDYLIIQVACIDAQSYGMDTIVRYKNRSATPEDLLTAKSASGAAAGAGTFANSFAASGFYQNVEGQVGTGGNVSASATTFLSGGAGSSNGTVNYGYKPTHGGFFQMQPIIVGAGGINSSIGGIGCGGGTNAASKGGPGMVLIASW